MIAVKNGWLDPGIYEHHPTENCGGYNDASAEPKKLWHSTESPPGSLDAVIRLFKDATLNSPHFTVDFKLRRRAQHAPITAAACALVGGGNVVSTNGVPVLQTEVCMRAAEAHLLTDDDLRFLAEHAEWVRQAQQQVLGRSFHHETTVKFYGLDAGFTLATQNAPQRLSAAEWRAYNGHIGHQHVPKNDHWDPGKLNVPRICELARSIQQGGTPPVPPEGGLTVADVQTILEAIDDLSKRVDQDHIDTRRYIPTRAVKVKSEDEQYLIVVGPSGGLARQHLTGELKSVLRKARVLSDIGIEAHFDYVELSDPAEVAAFRSLPQV